VLTLCNWQEVWIGLEQLVVKVTGCGVGELSKHLPGGGSWKYKEPRSVVFIESVY
jgi:hypothetical protein